MTVVVYEIIEHDGGWAYQVQGAYSETFPSHDVARKAAERAAREQHASGETARIAFEGEDGVWREETALGDDRPDTEVRG